MTAPATAEALDRIADTTVLLVALDFDGTLAPLQDEPMRSRMTPVARDAVLALATLPDTEVALVSGRSMADLTVISEHTDDSPLHLAGSHGAEFWHPGGGTDPVAEDEADDVRVRDALRDEAVAAVDGLDGVWIEPKAFGFGLHTRLASEADAHAAQDAVGAIVTEHAPHWRRRTGHNILEFAFRHEGKDTAVARLRELVGATGVVFAGDDVTDEDAMRTLGADDLGIRVGDGDSAATVRVADVDEMAETLAELARRRAARTHPQE